MPDVDIDSEKRRRNAIISATRNKFGANKVLNICAFRTEGSKSAILTACRGLGISVEKAQYIASLIPTTRGTTASLSVMIYGDVENDVKPSQEFINECESCSGLLETALTIEGMVCGRTIHASGVIIFEQPYYELNAMMRSPNKQPTTQWDMDDSAYAGGLKYDFLTIKNLDAMHKCLDFLLEYGYIKWQSSLRKTFDKYFHPDVLDYESEEMWRMAEEHEIVNLFQFMTSVGQQAVQKIKPKSLIELGVANAVMRLAASGDAVEQPLDTYVRYKNDLQQWYDCMDAYNLTQDEKTVIEKYLKPVSGMATMQEEVMMLVMEPKISNFTMAESNKLRKGIAKKKKSLQEEAKKNFYDKGLENGTSKNLLDYVWCECITPQLSYSFSQPHILGYSTIAVQEMNMAYKYPIIYWNCANLIIDSAADDEIAGGTTDYGKVGTAIAAMKNEGVEITFPLINEATFGFKPDEKNNRIIFGYKAINGVGDDLADLLVKGQPYESMDDFSQRMLDTNLVKTSQMVKLIKAGCFTQLHSLDRAKTMEWYLRTHLFSPCEKLTMRQFAQIMEMDLIPDSLELAAQIPEFKDSVLDDSRLVEKHIEPGKKIPKRGYHDGYYILNKQLQEFFVRHLPEDSVVGTKGEYFILSEKKFIKECDKLIQPLKDWFLSEEANRKFNDSKYQQIWNKYAGGSLPKWSMEALTYYDSDHELKGLDEKKYGVTNYFELPEEPVAYDYYTRYIDGERKTIPKYKISLIAGTIIDKDNLHHSIALLTCHGLVNAKLPRGQFAFYNKQISAKLDGDDKKTVLEKSWLKRGNKIFVCGIRQGDMFRSMKYNDTVFKHSVYLIKDIYDDGSVDMQMERTQVD